VAEHKDIRDEGQTVSLVDESVPETPEADTEPPKPDNPKTGDGAALLLTAIISMLALAGMLVMLIRRRYKR
jgi:LPXTG-motif cell wall-anchored protein